MSDKIDNHLLNYSNFQWSAVFTDSVFLRGGAGVRGEMSGGQMSSHVSARPLLTARNMSTQRDIVHAAFEYERGQYTSWLSILSRAFRLPCALSHGSQIKHS